MARLARLVIPGLPYHVTQRGNRRGITVRDYGDGITVDYGDSLPNALNSSSPALREELS
jgi:hypothetical protein